VKTHSWFNRDISERPSVRFHRIFIYNSSPFQTAAIGCGHGNTTLWWKGNKMNANESMRNLTARISRSITVKLTVIGILIVVLLIPVSMVQSLVSERERRRQAVVGEINSKWGQAQTIAGPVVSIPYRKSITDSEKRQVTVTRFFHLLPDELTVDCVVTPQVRYRGIYRAVLYHTRLTIEARFPDPEVDKDRIEADEIFYQGASIAMGITDMRGIRDRIQGTFDNSPLTMEPGMASSDVLASGVSAELPRLTSGHGHVFRMVLELNGSQELSFVPVGRSTAISARSSWRDPSFTGAFLPVERKVSPEGFSARWNVLHLNRNYPQSWTGSGHKLDGSAFGVRLFSPVDVYQKTTRTAKYALLFIAFAFMAFLLSEILNRRRVHPVQYLLVGMAIVLFYVLLLSISEHAAFGLAYLAASAAVIGLVSAYARTVLRSRAAALMVGGILAVLYGYLYILLQLEDYALLMGSIGLFALLALVMFMTRRIDWYGMQIPGVQPTAASGDGPAACEPLS
jgi:inner membrane protein